MPGYAYAILAIGWLVWFSAFPVTGWNFKTPQNLDRRARWGLLLEAIAYALLWQNSFWARAPGTARILISVVFFALAATLSWTGSRALGRHLRLDAGLDTDHQLVRSGPYRVVRHPIYTSMLCMLWGTGSMITPVLMLILSTVLFLIGTEIRVRIEDSLLESRFGAEFSNYRKAVSAYIPFVR
jgi:protein-S-isoprenylcysteine O-methyltransferase Ste14